MGYLQHTKTICTIFPGMSIQLLEVSFGTSRQLASAVFALSLSLSLTLGFQTEIFIPFVKESA